MIDHQGEMPCYGLSSVHPHRLGARADDCPECPQPYDPRDRTHGAEFESYDVHPCAFGRCPDPAAHAEGAHDL